MPDVRRLPVAVFTVAALVLGGCQTLRDDVTATREELPSRTEVHIADSYWSYAALAADVYATRGLSETLFVLPLSSSLLNRRAGPGATASADGDFRSRDDGELEGFDLQTLCPYGSAQNPEELESMDDRCAVLLPDQHRRWMKLRGQAEVERKKKRDQTDTLDGVAAAWSECDITADKPRPSVPLSKARDGEGWWRVKELDKYEATKDWHLFVPELAIDVWARERTDITDRRTFEYALVYRGTAGAGGWWSNIQFLSLITPLVWDQYRQAEASTKKIIRQIYYLHVINDRGRPQKTDILITAVGHSLGAGLARYMYYRIPHVTRVIGFNPSPVDGAHSLVSIDARPMVQGRRAGMRRDTEPWVQALPEPFARSTLFTLTERGEVLGRLKSCVSGPIWGSEGGPVQMCETVNLSRGNIFDQHDMRQLACKLGFLHFNRGRLAP